MAAALAVLKATQGPFNFFSSYRSEETDKSTEFLYLLEPNLGFSVAYRHEEPQDLKRDHVNNSRLLRHRNSHSGETAMSSTHVHI